MCFDFHPSAICILYSIFSGALFFIAFYSSVSYMVICAAKKLCLAELITLTYGCSMKKLSGFCLFLLVSFASGGASAYGFTFYKDFNSVNPLFATADYLGGWPGVNYGIVTDLAKSHNDEVSSISGSGCLIVFEHSDTRGRWTLITSSQSQLTPVYNNAISSFIYFRPEQFGLSFSCPIAILRQHNIMHTSLDGGDSHPLYPDRLILNLKSVSFNDKISSVDIPHGYCLKAWVDTPSNTILSNSALYQSWHNNPDLLFGAGVHDIPKKFNDEITAVHLVNCSHPSTF